jgi:hypothetical protein
MTSSILKYVTENELIWKDLVIRSEIETIKLLNKNAQIEFENQNPKFSECISKFLEIREKAIKNSYSSFIFFDTKYQTTETKRDDYIRKLAKKFNDKSGIKVTPYKWIRSRMAYRNAEPNAWIYKTLQEKKKLNLFKTCKTLVLVGCGMNPYSMFDIHKKYKHIKQIGIEIDPNIAKIGTDLVKYTAARNHINIVGMDGKDYDYGHLEQEDLVFVSCDVSTEKIIKRVIETSKAPIFICAPYEKTWLKNLVLSLKITKSSVGITSFADT